MRLNDHYDCVVLGSHSAALLTAHLAANHGLSVLLVPFEHYLRVGTSPSGHILDPEPNYLLGLGAYEGTNGILSTCLKPLLKEIPKLDSWAKAAENTTPQVVTPSNRFSLERGKKLHLEFKREFGEVRTEQMGLLSAIEQTEAAQIAFWLEYLKAVTTPPQKGAPSYKEQFGLPLFQKKLHASLKAYDTGSLSWIASKKRLTDWIQALNLEEFSEVFTGIQYAIAAQMAPQLDLSQLLHLLSMSRTAKVVSGGISGYRDLLLAHLKDAGIHSVPKVERLQIFVEKGRFIGVHLSSHGNVIRTSVGIVGCALNRIQDLIMETGNPWLPRKYQTVQPKGWRFTVSLKVKAQVIPEKLTSRVVWQEKEAPPLEIEVANPKTYGVDSTDKKWVFLRTCLPFTEESLKPEFRNLFAKRMLKQACEVIPFLEDHLLETYPSIRDQKQPDPFAFTSLKEIPDNLLIYDHEGIGTSCGIQGLYAVSQESYPALGSLGPTVAAIQALGAFSQELGIRPALV